MPQITVLRERDVRTRDRSIRIASAVPAATGLRESRSAAKLLFGGRVSDRILMFAGTVLEIAIGPARMAITDGKPGPCLVTVSGPLMLGRVVLSAVALRSTRFAGSDWYCPCHFLVSA